MMTFNLNCYIYQNFYTNKNIFTNIFIGSIVHVKYNLYANQIITYEGLVIKSQGNSYKKKIICQYSIDNKIVEHTFLCCSPNILELKLKDKIKVRHSKLYYLR